MQGLLWRRYDQGEPREGDALLALDNRPMARFMSLAAIIRDWHTRMTTLVVGDRPRSSAYYA
jgi:hypothetical protein